MWFSLAIMVVSLGISYFMRPKPKGPSAVAFDPESMPNVDEGTPQNVAFGDVWISDWQVLTFGNPRNKAIKTKSGK